MKTYLDGIYYDDICEEEQRNDFHIGQCYEKETCRTLICKKCKCDRLIVGVGSYFTAVKCPTCQWEYCIHNG